MKQISEDARTWLILLCFSYLMKMIVIMVKVPNYPIFGIVIGFIFPLVGLYYLFRK